MGDWGVVNDQPRLASCVAVGDVEVLSIGKFNFTATVDQLLLARLLQKTEEATKDDEEKSQSTGVAARKNALRAPSPVKREEELVMKFELISRREMRRAVAQM